MGVLFVFILSQIYVSFVLTEPLQPVVCAYAGVLGNGHFVFSEIPPGCKAILYGGNFFDVKPPDADIAAITELKNAGKIVYMLYMFSCSETWKSTINDPNCLEAYITPMVTYINENKIDGVFLGYLELHSGKIPDYPTKINSVIDTIKKGAPSTKVGLWIDGAFWEKFAEKNIFNFSVTNGKVDMYIIDTALAGTGCLPTTAANGGRIPLTTIENICAATAASDMDQSKLLMNFIDIVSKDTGSNDDLYTYSDYCSRNDSCIWCGDTIELFYCQVKAAQKVFKGIVISYADFDDTKNACECDKFPVLNTYIAAWENKPMKKCDKIG